MALQSKIQLTEMTFGRHSSLLVNHEVDFSIGIG